MELTEESIEALAVDEGLLVGGVAKALGIGEGQVAAVVGLFADDCTVPFIARYRKEKTGGLDEQQIRDIDHQYKSAKNLETRRIEIVRLIFGQGKLTDELYGNITGAASMAALEDIYAPYKRKKKTRGMLAREKGLEPLADAMRELEAAPLVAKATGFVGPEVATVEDALQGAMDIIAEAVSQDGENRARIKTFYGKDGKIIVKKSEKTDGDAKKAGVYQMYWDYTEALSQIKAHRILAINRGEREGVLDVTIDVDEAVAVQMIQRHYTLHNDYHKTAIEDGLKRLLSPAVIREIRGDQGDAADDHGIGVFGENLKNLLLQQPIKGTRVLGIDPGIRTGTKCAFLDETGKYLGSVVIYNHKVEEAKKSLLEGIRRYDVQLVAVGNGTGSREVQEIITSLIADGGLEVLFTVVDEDGASVYSASDIAREEFPDLDVTIRGAISIGRRLQDPLAELVKIDPKSIGVGLYQHDVNQKKLSDTLDEVVSSVVNNVGVNLNTTSVSLLRYVSGISGSLAKKIVQYRDEKGRIASRAELTSVPGMGPKSFEQCAGFLKIPESSEPLDNTWVHPENYPVARELTQTLIATTTSTLNSGMIAALKEKHGVGETTIRDIAEELHKPNRDPRDGYPKPIMRKGVMAFEDLHEGMMITGKIKNVVDFGAFVDLGIKETALVHISEMSDHFVKDPLETVKVGDVLEFRIKSLDVERRRIGLSRKTGTGERGLGTRDRGEGTRDRGEGTREQGLGTRDRGEGKREEGGGKRDNVTHRAQTKTSNHRSPNHHPHSANPEHRSHSPHPRPPTSEHRPPQSPVPKPQSPLDDGTMYNPFAEAFKKAGVKKTGKQ